MTAYAVMIIKGNWYIQVYAFTERGGFNFQKYDSIVEKAGFPIHPII